MSFLEIATWQNPTCVIERAVAVSLSGFWKWEEELTLKYLQSEMYEYGVHFCADYYLSCQVKE